MPIDIRVPTADDFDAIIRRDEAAFGHVKTDDDRERARQTLELDRFRIAVDAGDVVGVAGAYTKELTLPGGAIAPVGGTTWVSVAPTHRRQGLLGRLMEAVHDDVRERGEGAAILLASEGGIYERFGYGVATRWRVVEIDRRRTQIAERFRPSPGEVRLVDPLEELDRLVSLFDRCRRGRVGEVSRDATWIEHGLRRNEPGVRAALHDDGYALWKITADWGEGEPNNELRVLDLVAATPEAHAALWHLLLSHDLVTPVRARTCVSLDDPLVHLLTDPRALRTVALNDMLWVCPIDVAGLFEARSYRVDDALVVDVEGERWRIAADGVSATGAEPDLTMTRGAAGALLLGGVSATELAAGRRLSGVPDVVRRADAFLGWAPLAHCSTAF